MIHFCIQCEEPYEDEESDSTEPDCFCSIDCEEDHEIDLLCDDEDDDSLDE